MAKFPEAVARMFNNVFVCKDCKHKQKAQRTKILQNKVSCRNCKSKALRVMRLK